MEGRRPVLGIYLNNPGGGKSDWGQGGYGKAVRSGHILNIF